MRIYFPGFYTEAHRTEDRQQSLVHELTKLGIVCEKEWHPFCDLVFCGSIYKALNGYIFWSPVRDVPIIHYSWDIYPFQVTGPEERRWREYLSLLKTCTEVWVPSFSCLSRLEEYTGRADGKVVLSSCNCWDLPDRRKPWDGGYVLDVMRKYPDPNKDAVRDACKELGIPCVESATSLPWPKFQKTVAGARLLVSAYYEASTGGLTLLEGYRLGKPVLLSGSPKNGASEYFGDRAYYFEWNSMASLLKRLRWYYGHATVRSNQKEWVEENYSDAAFAKRLATNFERVLNVRS